MTIKLVHWQSQKLSLITF